MVQRLLPAHRQDSVFHDHGFAFVARVRSGARAAGPRAVR